MGGRWTSLLLVCAVAGCSTEEGATGQAFDPELTTASSTGGGNEPGGTSGTSSDPSTTATPTTSTPTTSTPTASGGDSSSTGMAETSEGESSTGGGDDCPRVRVTVGAGLTLNVRPDPSTVNPPIGSLADGALVDVIGEMVGESIDGEDLWYEIDNGVVQGFVLSTFVTCTTEQPPDIDPNGWYLPLPCGVSAEVTQGNNGALSHNGTSAFAFPAHAALVAGSCAHKTRIEEQVIGIRHYAPRRTARVVDHLFNRYTDRFTVGFIFNPDNFKGARPSGRCLTIENGWCIARSAT